MISASLLSDSPAANFPVLPYTQTEMKGEDKDKNPDLSYTADFHFYVKKLQCIHTEL